VKNDEKDVVIRDLKQRLAEVPKEKPTEKVDSHGP
jgi:hypothetical protein